MSVRVSIVVPVFNERATIDEIILRLQAVDIEKEILIVDDGSTDGTREFLQELTERCTTDSAVVTLGYGNRSLRTDNLRVFFQKTNYGKKPLCIVGLKRLEAGS